MLCCTAMIDWPRMPLPSKQSRMCSRSGKLPEWSLEHCGTARGFCILALMEFTFRQPRYKDTSPIEGCRRDLTKRTEALVTGQNRLSGMRKAILRFSLKGSLLSNHSQNSQKGALANPQLWQIIFSGCFQPLKLVIKQQCVIIIRARWFEFNLYFSSFLCTMRLVFYFFFRNPGKHISDTVTNGPCVLHMVKLTIPMMSTRDTASSSNSSVSSSRDDRAWPLGV